MSTETPEPWDTAKIREAFIHDGGEAEYYDPINGAREHRRFAGEAFDRWLAAHDAEVRATERERAALHAEEGYRLEERCDDIAKRIRSGYPAEIAARPGVVAQEPEGRRWFSAAYRAQNGNIIPIGDETVLAEYAQKTVDEFAREDDEGPDYFLASRIDMPWVPVKQEGSGQ